MKEQLVTFDTAKLAKEKGFDVPCNSYIYTPKALKLVNKNREGITGTKNTFEKNHIFTQRNKYHKGREVDRNKYSTTVSVPTQSLLQKWLREVHNIAILVSFNDNNEDEYYYFIHTNTKKAYSNRICSLPFKVKTYEEALEKGLQEVLKTYIIMKNPAKVIMLPTNVVDYCCREGELVKHNSELFIADSDFRDPNNGCYTQQHLYITTDEEIKVGDWVYNTVSLNTKTNSHVYPITKLRELNNSNCKKIIATTDKSLGLPQIPQQFIGEYCRKGGIDKVMVEYEVYDSTPHNISIYKKFKTKLRLNQDNTITIHQIKEIKDSWTREEVKALFKKYHTDSFKGLMYNYQFDRNNWLKNFGS